MKLLLLLLATSLLQGSRSQEVVTANGRLRGSRVSVLGKSVDVYLGVPFAKPPVGDLRFMHPQPADSWGTEVKDALQWKPSCFQPQGQFFVESYRRVPMELSEDCLYLNVWVPSGASPTSNLPTMVWIHGGGFFMGSPNQELTYGQFLAAENNVIVVALSYRLGPLGFSFLGPDTIPGNMGLMDQRMGIKWVHDNIANFGGTQSKITLFGQSAGGASVGYHLLSPLSRDLFTSAILQSGAPNSYWAINDHQQARYYVKKLANLTGCQSSNDADVMDCLKVADSKSLMDKQLQLFFEGRMVFRPVVDGYFLTDSPRMLLKRGDFKKTDILLGVVKDEGTLMFAVSLPGYPNISQVTLTKDTFDGILSRYAAQSGFSSWSKPLTHFYEDAKLPTGRPSYIQIMNELQSDVDFRCPAVVFASTYAKTNRVYLYDYEHRLTNSVTPEWFGATHTYDLEATFGIPLNDSLGFSDQEKELSRRMMTYWTNFAKSGDPNSPVFANSSWPTFDTIQLQYKVLDVGSNLATRVGLRHEQCVFVSDILTMIPRDENTGPGSNFPYYCTSTGHHLSPTLSLLTVLMALVAASVFRNGFFS